ncbi:hypothetical protein L3X38_030677 [Prunus dulcis]|uniref:RNase H type-1 domain-containing protein n=1 Tax=Prunus dulcis TaxID=3755 RepID=A0AAD4YUA2_PRUDU|nr:hypothetical protein L3X38_030677 [Prunus dulcis]
MWQLRIDEVSNQKGAGVGVVIITLDGTLLEQAITLGIPASNNEAEYEALLAGLRLTKKLSIKKLVIYSDSQWITNQASGEYMAKHPRMILSFIPVEHLDQPSIEKAEQPNLMQIDEDPYGNGQAEASNEIVLDYQKKKLEGTERKWVEELPRVLWAAQPKEDRPARHHFPWLMGPKQSSPHTS